MLAALESSLRDIADHVAQTRERLGGPPPVRDAPSRDVAPNVGRARLREGPLGDLFRSTVEQAVASRVEMAPVPARTAVEGANGSSWLEPGAARVEPRLARIVAGSERELGAEHADTLWAVHDLVGALTKAGETALARRLAARLVSTRTRTLGPDHPHTVRANQLRGSQ